MAFSSWIEISAALIPDSSLSSSCIHKSYDNWDYIPQKKLLEIWSWCNLIKSQASMWTFPSLILYQNQNRSTLIAAILCYSLYFNLYPQFSKDMQWNLIIFSLYDQPTRNLSQNLSHFQNKIGKLETTLLLTNLSDCSQNKKNLIGTISLHKSGSN